MTLASSSHPAGSISGPALYRDPGAPISARVADLLSRMTLEEKIGQMTLVEKDSLGPQDVTDHLIGAVLSGGGGHPAENTAAAWLEMVASFQQAAMRTRLGIPLLYGVDAVHGHGNLYGAVIFPDNIGLGAARDPDLAFRVARATAEEVAATGIRWNYAPCVAVPQDIRWGRTYEGFGEQPDLVASLAAAYVRGLQGDDLASPGSVLATPKHFAADGGTTWGSSTWEDAKIDQGDAQVDEATLRAVHLLPYQEAVRVGARCVMASFSSWNGQQLHSSHYLLTEVLKGEYGFAGFVVTDWQAIDHLAHDYYQAVVMAINAGIDMSMVPFDFTQFIETLGLAVEKGDVPAARVDDAVRRILTVKFELGLFEQPAADASLLERVGTQEHRERAREAVGRSLVLLKNEGRALPLDRQMPRLLVAGQWADDIGLQCGGWTIEWRGQPGDITPGTTLLQAIRKTVPPEMVVDYHPEGEFALALDEHGQPQLAAAGLVAIGEQPYAEWYGDCADLSLTAQQIALIQRMRSQVHKLIVVLVSGRPLILTEQLPLMDALVAAWLPGTEGQGVADALFGDIPFTGKLPYTWPRSMQQIPFRSAETGRPAEDPLFPFGFGLA